MFEVLHCDHCEFSYALIRQAGDRCEDYSWVPDQWFEVARRQGYRIGVRQHRDWMCKGRVWPDGHTKLAKRWDPERLASERRRLGQAYQSRLDAWSQARQAKWAVA